MLDPDYLYSRRHQHLRPLTDHMVLLSTLSALLVPVDQPFAAMLAFTNGLYVDFSRKYSALAKEQDTERLAVLLQPKSSFRLSFLGYFHLKDELSPADLALATLIQSTREQSFSAQNTLFSRLNPSQIPLYR